MQLVARVSFWLCEPMLNLTNEGTSTIAIFLHLKAFTTALPILQAQRDKHDCSLLRSMSDAIILLGLQVSPRNWRKGIVLDCV